MRTENERIFVRKTKTGFIATYNGVKGKAKTMFKAVERAQKKWLEREKEPNHFIDALEYSKAANLEELKRIETTSSLE